MVGELEYLAADGKPVLLIEGHGCHGTIRIPVSGQESVRFGMRDDDRLASHGLRATNVIGVEVTVDEMCDRLVGHFRDGGGYPRTKRLRRIDDHDAIFVGHEHGLNPVVRDHVETVTELLRSVALGRIHGWSFRGVGNIDILVNSYADGCDRRHVGVRHTRCTGAGFVLRGGSGTRPEGGDDHNQHPGATDSHEPPLAPTHVTTRNSHVNAPY